MHVELYCVPFPTHMYTLNSGLAELYWGFFNMFVEEVGGSKMKVQQKQKQFDKNKS